MSGSYHPYNRSYRTDIHWPMNDATARELATSLLPHLEALANVHFLLDKHLQNPETLRSLRLLEEDIFADVLQLTRRALENWAK
jgi:hypothetical protein